MSTYLISLRVAFLHLLNTQTHTHTHIHTGILVQLPLPGHIHEQKVLDTILPDKDVDGLHPLNLAQLAHTKYVSHGFCPSSSSQTCTGWESCLSCFLFPIIHLVLPTTTHVRNSTHGPSRKFDLKTLPYHAACTPQGCIELIERSGVSIEGKEAVVIGRSNIVGIPVTLLLMQVMCRILYPSTSSPTLNIPATEDPSPLPLASLFTHSFTLLSSFSPPLLNFFKLKQPQKNATVTIVHSRTKDAPSVVKRADIVVAAVGRAEMVKGDWIKPGAIVIDVGINSVDDPSSKKGYKLVGDVDFESAKAVAGKITPVPGGVGPMTIAMLLRNTLQGARRSLAAKAEEPLGQPSEYTL